VTHYKNILIATDFNPGNTRPIHIAKSLLGEHRGGVSLVHVIEPIPAYGYPGFDNLESPVIDEAKKQLATLAKLASIPKERQYIRFGAVKTKVLELAREISSDLILVGSHGRHGLSRLLGSSANGIVHHATCDVLTIRVSP
jgi:universal stress protein A